MLPRISPMLAQKAEAPFDSAQPKNRSSDESHSRKQL